MRAFDIIGIVFIIAGVYLLNLSFEFIPMPDPIKSIEKWIVLIGGGLLVISGIRFFLAKRSA